MKKRFQLIALKFQEYELANEFEDVEKDDEPVDDELDFQESVKNNILKDISENLAVPSNCRRYSTVTYKFSYIIFNFSRNVIPLPSKISLLKKFEPELTKMRFNLYAQDDPKELFQPYEQMTNANEIPICLALDATCIHNDYNNSKSGVMIYQVQPFDKTLPDFVLHYSIGERINVDTKSELSKCIKVLKKTKFVPIFIASDGDRGSDTWHTEAFLRYKKLILEGKSLEEILEELDNLYLWPVSDLFHLLKNMRSRLFKGGVYFNKTSEKVSVDKLKKFIRVKETLSDKSDIAKMKDSFAADLFSILISTSCILDECYEESAYTFPFSLIYTAITSNYLSFDARIQILTKCFDFFADYFQNYPSIDEEGGLHPKSGP